MNAAIAILVVSVWFFLILSVVDHLKDHKAHR